MEPVPSLSLRPGTGPGEALELPLWEWWVRAKGPDRREGTGEKPSRFPERLPFSPNGRTRGA
ncbi:hypothetical protein JCM9492_13170 [Aquifex pyrophilus]